jgi:hypothetical protein
LGVSGIDSPGVTASSWRMASSLAPWSMRSAIRVRMPREAAASDSATDCIADVPLATSLIIHLTSGQSQALVKWSDCNEPTTWTGHWGELLERRADEHGDRLPPIFQVWPWASNRALSRGSAALGSISRTLRANF